MARVLIVDDSMFMRKTLNKIIVGAGHEVVGEAENPKIAIESYFSLKPDLVFLDIVLPEVDGESSLSTLKTIIGDNPSAKVVMVSAMAQEEVVSEFKEAGASDFIIKPFKAEYISSIINQMTE